MPVSVSDGLWVDNGVDAGEFRKALGSSLVVPGDATGVVPRAGRLAGPGSPLAVTATVPASMAVQVNAGKAHTFRSATYGGTLGIGPDGLATVPIPAAPASGSQWHRVYLLQRDTNPPASDTTAGAVIDVVSGVAAGSPTAPALPAGALLLGDVILPAGATSVLAAHITDRPTYTAPRGGILPVASQAERVALSTAGLAYPTLEVLELDTGRLLWHDGTRFRYDGDRVIVTGQADANALTAYAGLRAYDSATKRDLYYNGATWVKLGGPTEVLLMNASIGSSGLSAADSVWRNLFGIDTASPIAADTCLIELTPQISGTTNSAGNMRVKLPDGTYYTKAYNVNPGGAAAPFSFLIRTSVNTGAIHIELDIQVSAGQPAGVGPLAARITI